jgi:hypothetical protein
VREEYIYSAVVIERKARGEMSLVGGDSPLPLQETICSSPNLKQEIKNRTEKIVTACKINPSDQ